MDVPRCYKKRNEMNPTKKHKHYNLEQAIIYTTIATVLAIIGFMQSNSIILIGAIIVSACAFIGGVRQGDFLLALKYGGIFIAIGLGLYYIWHRKQAQMDKYAHRRKRHGAAIH